MIYKLLPTRVFRSYIGGKNLDILEGKNTPSLSRFPEDWIASVTEAFNPNRNIPDEGLSKTVDGKTLRNIILDNKETMIGKRTDMSLLFKLLDSSERLVIQAHPTVDFANKYFGSPYGKTECWYILNDGGYVYIGFKEGITKEKWKTFFEKQDIEGMLDSLHKFTVKKGDFIFVPGGVPHAIGDNCFLAELQEPTDLMVIPERVTPSGVVLPDQKLHGGLGFELMFDCFTYEGYNEEETRKRYFIKPQKISETQITLADNTITDKFRFDSFHIEGIANINCGSYGIALVIEGQGEVNGIPLCKGERVFIPEYERRLAVESENITFLLCRPPL